MAPAGIERVADEEDGALRADWKSTVDVGCRNSGSRSKSGSTPRCCAAGVRAGAAAGGTGGVVETQEARGLLARFLDSHLAKFQQVCASPGGQCPGQGNDADVDAFYGIVIQMFWLDHPPPHFHALYAEHEALIDIRILEVIEGNLPRRALALTLEWAREHRDELMEDWNLCRQRQSPKTIEPLR
jgi:hypothetical protein